MKIGRYFIVVLMVIGFFILFGDKGLVDYFSLKAKMLTFQEANERIACENRILKEKIVLLRHDSRYIETVARHDLGMVRKGDIVYRFVE